MGYLVGFNTQKVVELEEHEVPTAEHIEELQLTEVEQAEFEAV